MKKSLLAMALLVVSGCTSIQVASVSQDENIKHICIEENEKVIVASFLNVLRNRIEYHGINTSVHDSAPDTCEYVLTYSAYKTWDIAAYLYKADLRLEKSGLKIATAEYRLKGKGGFSLMKWQSVKTKMTPVIDRLLSK